MSRLSDLEDERRSLWSAYYRSKNARMSTEELERKYLDPIQKLDDEIDAIEEKKINKATFIVIVIVLASIVLSIVGGFIFKDLFTETFKVKSVVQPVYVGDYASIYADKENGSTIQIKINYDLVYTELNDIRDSGVTFGDIVIDRLDHDFTIYDKDGNELLKADYDRIIDKNVERMF